MYMNENLLWTVYKYDTLVIKKYVFTQDRIKCVSSKIIYIQINKFIYTAHFDYRTLSLESGLERLDFRRSSLLVETLQCQISRSKVFLISEMYGVVKKRTWKCQREFLIWALTALIRGGEGGTNTY